MKTLKFRDHLTYDPLLTYSDKAFPPSLTIPNQVLTLDQFIKRFQNNLAVPYVAMQNVDGDVSNFDNMDIFQRIDYQRRLQKRIETLKDKSNSELAERAKLDAKTKFDAAVIKAASELPQSSNNEKP